MPSITYNITHGVYRLRKGDTPRKVAEAVYGDGSKASVLLQANPEAWIDGDAIQVPNKAGVAMQVRYDGQSAAECIRSMFPDQPTHIYLDRFFLYNGGQTEELQMGDLVFVPNR